ncbi:MAG: MmgE/PrpD family protein [Candidatus Bathyarchaeia archaeon]
MSQKLTKVHELAQFVTRASFKDLSPAAKQELKIRVLDALGCAIGALEGEPIRMLQVQLDDFGGKAHCTLVGGGKTAPDLAALYNGALVRYLDFNDSYLAKGETCHPNDNVGAVLAAAEYAKAKGADFLLALAVAYQVQCRLSDVAPVRSKGFDHTTQGSYAAAAGVSKALGLDVEKTANAIAISGTALNALRVTRTGKLSHWKGLAYPFTGFGATHAAFLAMRGITGPAEVFEGNKGFMDSIAGKFEIDWSKENLERVTRTIIKKYNAEVHSQSSIEGILDLKREQGFAPADIEKVEVEVFDVAYNIIGGGEEGEKKHIRTKEQADHSLPYIVAVAILDGTVMPEQYYPDRITRSDVQELLQKIAVRPREDYSRRFPDEMPSHLIVHLKGGRVVEKEKRDYEGFFTRPMGWERAVQKFDSLSTRYVDKNLRKQIVDCISQMEDLYVTDLTELLENIPDPKRGTKR